MSSNKFEKLKAAFKAAAAVSDEVLTDEELARGVAALLREQKRLSESVLTAMVRACAPPETQHPYNTACHRERRRAYWEAGIDAILSQAPEEVRHD